MRKIEDPNKRRDVLKAAKFSPNELRVLNSTGIVVQEFGGNFSELIRQSVMFVARRFAKEGVVDFDLLQELQPDTSHQQKLPGLIDDS